MELRIVDFSAEWLDRVQEFHCGSELWAEWAAEWIKNAPPFPCALQSMKDHGNKVWLYLQPTDTPDEDRLVGFTSLGTTQWPDPPPNGPRRPLGFIPMFAVSSDCQSVKHSSLGRRYSDLLMDDLLAQARQSGFRELGLYVHQDNIRAIRFYERHGFGFVNHQDRRENRTMVRFL